MRNKIRTHTKPLCMKWSSNCGNDFLLQPIIWAIPSSGDTQAHLCLCTLHDSMFSISHSFTIWPAPTEDRPTVCTLTAAEYYDLWRRWQVIEETVTNRDKPLDVTLSQYEPVIPSQVFVSSRSSRETWLTRRFSHQSSEDSHFSPLHLPAAAVKWCQAVEAGLQFGAGQRGDRHTDRQMDTLTDTGIHTDYRHSNYG
jgi:hypothetical protein